MKACILACIGCGILAGCANPVDEVAQSVEKVSLASVKYPIALADFTIEKAREQRNQH